MTRMLVTHRLLMGELFLEIHAPSYSKKEGVWGVRGEIVWLFEPFTVRQE